MIQESAHNEQVRLKSRWLHLLSLFFAIAGLIGLGLSFADGGGSGSLGWLIFAVIGLIATVWLHKAALKALEQLETVDLTASRGAP